MISRRSFIAFAFLIASATPGLGAQTQAFTREAFAAAQAAGKSIIIHVYAPWCPTCRAQEPIVQRVEADPKYADVAMFRVDFDGQKDAVRALKANRQSTIIVFKGAKELDRLVGVTDAAVIGALLAKAL